MGVESEREGGEGHHSLYIYDGGPWPTIIQSTTMLCDYVSTLQCIA